MKTRSDDVLFLQKALAYFERRYKETGDAEEAGLGWQASMILRRKLRRRSKHLPTDL